MTTNNLSDEQTEAIQYFAAMVARRRRRKVNANIEEINANIQAVEKAEANEEARQPEFTEEEIAAYKARYISKNFWDCLD